jgi:hypothetical protein
MVDPQVQPREVSTTKEVVSTGRHSIDWSRYAIDRVRLDFNKSDFGHKEEKRCVVEAVEVVVRRREGD